MLGGGIMTTAQMTPEDIATKQRIVRKPYVAGIRHNLLTLTTVIFTRKMILPDGQEDMQITFDDFLNYEEHFDRQWEEIATKQANRLAQPNTA